MNAITLAAWIIIVTALGKLLFGWWNDRQKEIERLAVSYEYEDERTSHERRQLLLMRYPQNLIPEPDIRFRELAWKEYRAKQKDRRSYRAELVDYLVAVLLIVVAAGAAFLGYAVYLKRATHQGYGSAFQTAFEFMAGLIVSHVIEVTVMTVCIGTFTALLVKFLRSA